MNNRLQFRHHSEIFDTRKAAIEYIINDIRRTDTGLAAEDESYGFSLLAEPTVLLYKNEEDPTFPHLILAIGSQTSSSKQYGENRFCFIDVDNADAEFEKYKEEVAALIKSITVLTENTNTLHLTAEKTDDGTILKGDVQLAESNMFDNVKRGNIIMATDAGLYTYVNIDFDKENNKISYQINGATDDFVIPNNYLVSGEYKVEDESLHFKLSESAEEVVVSLEALLDEWDVDKNPSTPIILKKETIGYGSDTRQGHSPSSHLEPWQDILSADVRLSDNDNNILVKSNEGKSLYVKGTADNIKYFKNGKEITVAQALDNCLEVSSDNENIIYKKEDGFAASVSIKYEKTENAIYFYKSNRKGEKEQTKLELNSTNLTNSYYDPKTERIVLQFITATGSLETRYIDLSSIMDLEWDVRNEGHSVKLYKTRQGSNSADILSADVKISDAENNILVEKDHTLYVKGTANNIKYGKTTVKESLDSLVEENKDTSKKLDELSTSVDKKLESISAADTSVVVDNSSKLNPTIKTNISKDADNLIKLNADGLNAYAKLSYDKSKNYLTFRTSAGEVGFQLNGVSIIDDMRYDHNLEKIVITYHTYDGETKTLEIDVKDLIAEWGVTSDTSGAIKLSQSQDSTGRHIVSATTIVNTSHGDNMLVNDHGSLYVSSKKVDSNTAAIEKLTDRVSTVETIADAATDKNNEQDRTLATLRTDLNDEIALQANHYDELSKGVADNKQAVADNKQAIKDNAKEIAVANDAIAKTNADLAQEIKDRDSKDAELAASIAKNASDIETEKDNRIDAITTVNTALQDTNAKLKAVSDTVDVLNGDASTVGSVREMVAHTKADLETAFETAITTEKTRATEVEADLQKEIDALSGGSKDYVDAQIEKLDTKVTTEIATAKSEAIKTAEEKAIEFDNQVRKHAEDLVTDETTRAEKAELDNANAIADLQTTDKEIKSDIATNAANIAANAVAIADANKDIQGLQTRISNAEGKIDTFNEKAQDALTKIAAEETRATAAETANATAIKAEETRATNAEDVLTTALNNEIQARKDADVLLDAAIKKATSEFNDSASITFTKVESTDKTSYTAAVKVATGENNIISNSNDGLHATVKLAYDSARNAIWLTKDNGDKLTSEIQLNAGSIIDGITYDKENKIIDISYTTAQGETRHANVPVSDLFNEWDVDNTAKGSGIELTKKTSATETSVDLLSAKILISPLEHNMAQLDTNGLFVDGSKVDEISGKTDCAQNEIDAIEDVLGVVGSCDTPIEYHKTAYQVLSAATSFTDADAKLESAILDTNKVFHDTVTSSAYIKVTDANDTKDIKAYVRVSNNADNAVELIETGNDADNANGIYLSGIWDCGAYDGGTEIDIDTYLTKFAN